MKKQIIAIGGGVFHPSYYPRTAIEEYIIKLSGKQSSVVLNQHRLSIC